MYNFSFNHDHKFWTILIIKDIQKSRFNVEIIIQSNPTLNYFSKVQDMCTFLCTTLDLTVCCITGLDEEK
jgi:hypothetical protein